MPRLSEAELDQLEDLARTTDQTPFMDGFGRLVAGYREAVAALEKGHRLLDAWDAKERDQERFTPRQMGWDAPGQVGSWESREAWESALHGFRLASAAALRDGPSQGAAGGED